MGELSELIGRSFDVLQAKIERLENENAELKIIHNNNRWNVLKTDTGIKICFGEHATHDPCEWEYFISEKPTD